jgi:hypothetical protein
MVMTAASAVFAMLQETKHMLQYLMIAIQYIVLGMLVAWVDASNTNGQITLISSAVYA